MSVKVKTDTAIEVTLTFVDDETGEEHEETYNWTLEEARAIKDELIRAVGAQNYPTHKPGVRGGLAPVLQPVGGFKVQPDVRGNGVVHPNDRVTCHCGGSGWGLNGSCGISGCNNVPG